MTIWTTARIQNRAGTTAVVTGANGGLGLETATVLAGAGAHVVMAARNQPKATAACDQIRARHPDASVEVVELDLASLDSVRSAAEAIIERHPRIDLLINNAGLMAVPAAETADGFEIQFGVNHLGHFALTALLLPGLLAADAARVVTVTSVARHLHHPAGSFDAHLGADYEAWSAYGQSKMANHLFALGLDQRCRRAGIPIRSFSAHPGLSNTDLQTTTLASGGGGRAAALSLRLASVFGMPAKRGAWPQLRAATDPAAQGGQLYGPRFASFGPAVRLATMGRSRRQDHIDALWRLSEQETGITLDLAATSPSP